MKKISVTMIVIFVAFLALVSGGSLLMKDREFSPNENRYLAEPPRLTVDNILSGKFQDGLENYLRDQICFRDGWITVKTGIQKACKDTDIGGAYVGKDGYDFEKITPEDVDEKQIARNVKAVQDFFAKASENVEKDRISFLLVPSSGLVMADKLPAHARLFDQAKYIDQIEKQMKDCRVTDVREKLLSHNEDYIYYKTDHHWTTLGAFYAFPCIKEFGMTSDEFATRFLQEEKVAVVPGTAFGECGEGFLRISYAYSLEDLKVALGRLERFIEKLRNEDKASC